MLLALQNLINLRAVAARSIAQEEWYWDEVTQPDFIPLGYQNTNLVISPPSDEWDWNEIAPSDLIITGYQQINSVPSTRQEDTEWDWGEQLSSDIVPSGYQQINAIVSVQTQLVQEEWDFTSDFGGEDGWSNHFVNYDVPTIYDDVWDWDEVLPSETIPLGYQNSSVVVSISPIQQMDADWDWDETVVSDVISTGYQQVDLVVVINSSQQPQEEWDYSSDFGGEDGWSNHFTNYDVPAVYDLDWDWDEVLEDEFFVEDVQLSIIPPSLLLNKEDPWDWDEYGNDNWEVDYYLHQFIIVQYPPPWEVMYGVQYGPTGVEYTGTYIGNITYEIVTGQLVKPLTLNVSTLI